MLSNNNNQNPILLISKSPIYIIHLLQNYFASFNSFNTRHLRRLQMLHLQRHHYKLHSMQRFFSRPLQLVQLQCRLLRVRSRCLQLLQLQVLHLFISKRLYCLRVKVTKLSTIHVYVCVCVFACSAVLCIIIAYYFLLKY